jgi:hypothetical protein
VSVTQRVDIAICTPAVTDDCCTFFDVLAHFSRQRFGGPVLYRNEECSTRPSFYS